MRWLTSRNKNTLAGCIAAGFAIFHSGVARADVLQPSGAVIPAAPASLSGFLNGSANNDGINEGIDVVADAAVEPQVFSPLCSFSGKYIAKGGGANFAVGWYNVDDARPNADPPRYVPVDLGANLNTAAPSSDIQILFPFSTNFPPAGMRDLSALSIRDNPAYAGGLIGFVLIPNPNGTGNGNATQYHYTEHRFNVQCTQCTSPGPWYSDLIYRSNELANTFYLGFEDLDFRDLPGQQGVNGNDLDYEDFLFRFSGITCRDAGRPCEIADNVGICRLGITDCDAQGETVCLPVIEPGSQPEQCDGADNDCNGSIDDGATCPGEQVCSRGRCVDRCGSSEFQCAEGLVCDAGLCVEESCVDVPCAEGEVCYGGDCRAACEGVVCPHGQVCRNGSCLDPCAGVSCGDGQVCVSGVCVTACGCRGCPDGERCAVSTGQCVEEACENVVCEPGTYCSGGTCVDLCEGVVCPAGERCESGSCVPAPPPPPDDDPEIPPPDFSSSSSSSSAGSGGAGPAAEPGAGRSIGASSGCSCRVGAGGASRGAAAGSLLALLLGLRRSRRGRRSTSRRRSK